MVINYVCGFIAHVGDAAVDFRLATVFAEPAIAGSLVAARLTDRLPADRLRRWCSYLVFATAVFVIVREGSATEARGDVHLAVTDEQDVRGGSVHRPPGHREGRPPEG